MTAGRPPADRVPRPAGLTRRAPDLLVSMVCAVETMFGKA
jgi:hypothetical protein